MTECISHTLVQKHVFGRSLENAWGATDEKPEGAVEVMLEGDVATQAAQQDAALASGVNLDDTSQSTTTASTATPDRYFHPLPELVLNDTRAKLDKCVLDAWNRNPDREADEICSDIRSFLDVVKVAAFVHRRFRLFFCHGDDPAFFLTVIAETQRVALSRNTFV